MQSPAKRPSNVSRLIPVKAIENIEFLIKESEVITGRSGRRFVIASADRLSYRVHFCASGLLVERLDSRDRAIDTRHVLPWEFDDHSLSLALSSGQLFTHMVGTD